MDINRLKNRLNSLSGSLQGREGKLLQARLKSLMSVFPFNEYEYILMFLLDRGVIKFTEYEKLRSGYVASNRYLELYGLAPRVFGEIWAHEHIMDLSAKFLKPDRAIDPKYKGQYDLSVNNVKVEVKSSWAINTKKRGNLVAKALRRNSSEPFWMNFQQLKPATCDVFIFIGIWLDEIVYWVLSILHKVRNCDFSEFVIPAIFKRESISFWMPD